MYFKTDRKRILFKEDIFIITMRLTLGFKTSKLTNIFW